MAIDYSKYPNNWKDIRKQVLERDNHCCQFCCLENYARGYRTLTGVFISSDFYQNWFERDDWHDYNFGEGNIPKPLKIILTIAHLGIDKEDGTPGNKQDTMDCRLNNLAALCQKCHNRFDMPDRLINRKKTLMKKREQKILDSGQLRLL